MFLMKHFSTWSIFHWSLKKCLLPISIAIVVREKSSFIKIMQTISPNYPWENGVKLIKRAEEKLSQSCVLSSIAKDKDPSSRVKMHLKKFFWFLPPFTLYLLRGCDLFNMSYFSLISLIASSDISLCLSTLNKEIIDHFNLKIKITKGEHKKIFWSCGPSKIFKNNSWPINIYLKTPWTSLLQT